MAPKHGRPTVGTPVVRKKRTVRRPARQPSPSSDSTHSASTPSVAPGPSSPQVDILAGRVITMGRKVDFSFFEDEGFAIGRQLKDMGWEMVCSLDLPTYPSLVKDFYSNLARGDGGLVSTVRGTRIHITSEILGNILSCPVSGVAASAHSDRGSALSRMLGRDIADLEEIRANQLPLELRLLHNICSRVLFPKTGRFEYVSERDIAVMDSVITGQPLNLPGMMIWYMAESASKKRATLPYGMILTKVFQSQGVNILKNEPKKTLRHTDYYNKATLHRMGYSKVNGNWVRRGSKDDSAADVDAGVHGASEGEPSMRHMSPGPSSPAPSAPPPAPASSTQSTANFSDTQLEQLRLLLSVHKEELKTELNSNLVSLNEMFYSLDNRVSKIESDLESSLDALKTDVLGKIKEIKEIGCNVELKEKISETSAFLDKRLNDFIKSQSEELKKFLDEFKKQNGS